MLKRIGSFLENSLYLCKYMVKLLYQSPRSSLHSRRQYSKQMISTWKGLLNGRARAETRHSLHFCLDHDKSCTSYTRCTATLRPSLSLSVLWKTLNRMDDLIKEKNFSDEKSKVIFNYTI